MSLSGTGVRLDREPSLIFPVGIRKTAGRACANTGADSPPNRIKMFCLSATHIAMVKITGEAAKRAAHALPAVSQPVHDNTAGTGVGLDLGQMWDQIWDRCRFKLRTVLGLNSRKGMWEHCSGFAAE